MFFLFFNVTLDICHGLYFMNNKFFCNVNVNTSSYENHMRQNEIISIKYLKVVCLCRPVYGYLIIFSRAFK